MKTVLAAIDESAAAQPVLDTALGIGQLTGAHVEAIHVKEGSGATAQALSARRGVGLRLLDGPVEGGLLRALEEPDVVAGVFGARGTRGDRRPVGSTALRVLERASKPIVVVPPAAAGVSPRAFRRLLVPLEGSEESARPVADDLGPLIMGDIELVVVHVFTTETAPRVVDHPEWDLPVWGEEFLARFCPNATRIDLRAGVVGSGVSEACQELGADLIVLSWSQDASPGHAAVVRDVLGRSAVPMLLLPVDGPAKIGTNATSAGGRPR